MVVSVFYSFPTTKISLCFAVTLKYPSYVSVIDVTKHAVIIARKLTIIEETHKTLIIINMNIKKEHQV